MPYTQDGTYYNSNTGPPGGSASTNYSQIQYPPDSGGASGSMQNLDFLQKQARAGLTTGLSDVENRLIRNLINNINKQGDRDLRKSNQQLASTGMGKSGLRAALVSQIAGGKQSALAEGSANIGGKIAQMELTQESNLMQQLLGIDRARLGAFKTDQDILYRNKAFREQQRQFNEQFQFQQDQASFDFMRDLLPGLISAGSSVATSAAAPTPTSNFYL